MFTASASRTYKIDGNLSCGQCSVLLCANARSHGSRDGSRVASQDQVSHHGSSSSAHSQGKAPIFNSQRAPSSTLPLHHRKSRGGVSDPGREGRETPALAPISSPSKCARTHRRVDVSHIVRFSCSPAPPASFLHSLLCFSFRVRSYF